MPAELFRSASSYTPVRRRASLLPVSIAAHVALIPAIFTAPLFGDIDFPPPNRPLNFAYTNVVLPPPKDAAFADCEKVVKRDVEIYRQYSQFVGM